MDPLTADPIRKNCWLLLHLSLKPAEEDDITAFPGIELSMDRITAHRTHSDAAEAAALCVMYRSDQQLSSYIVIEASELQMNLHSRLPRESDEQEDCTCEENGDTPLTFGISQTCVRCGGFVRDDDDNDGDEEEVFE